MAERLINMNPKRILLFIINGLLFITAEGQVFMGQVIDAFKSTPITNVTVEIDQVKLEITTNETGEFNIDQTKLPATFSIKLSKSGYYPLQQKVNLNELNGTKRIFSLVPIKTIHQEIATIELDQSDDTDESDVYSLLTSSDDPIQKAAAFQFGIFRMKLRGIGDQWSRLGFNGFLLNDLQQGKSTYQIFSGQNKLTDYTDGIMGYNSNEDDFGDLGLNQWISFNPVTYRKGLSLNYSVSNRSYTHRLGAQYVKHFNRSKVSLVLGANRRWAFEGFIPGTFYDAWGAYVGLAKKINKLTDIQLLLVNAPVQRGKSSPGTKEVFDLSDDRLYNSYWGFQSGKKRNSRIAKIELPTAFLNLSSKLSDHLQLNIGLMATKGKRSDSSIDWTNSPDPRPDYYQKLPSYIQDSVSKAAVTYEWKNNVNVRQINWNQFYQANYNQYSTVKNINGGSDSVSGRRAVYFLNERHSDPTDLEHFLNLKWHKSRNSILLGYRIEYLMKENYLLMSDLLGADFFVDKEDFVDDQNLAHPNVNNLNHIVYEGDRYGYDYTSKHYRYDIFTQWEHKFKKWDLMFGVDGGYKSDRRKSDYKNLIFENSSGSSEIFKAIQYGIKSSLTYKLNGRNYILANLAYASKAPFFTDVFINPQWRSDRIQDVTNATVYQSSLHYFYRSPGAKIQLGGYAIQIKDLTQNKNFYLDEALEDATAQELANGGFINAFYTHMDQRYVGLDLAIEYNLSARFELTFAGQVGDYIYSNRPTLLLFDQYSKAEASHLIYLKNFFIPGTPQIALTAGLKYNFKRNGFFGINVSYLDKSFVEVNPLKRIPETVGDLDRDGETFKKINDQEKLPSAVVVDAFIFKSYRFLGHYSSVSLSVNNILNNTNLVSGGFEQNRFDFKDKQLDQFPNKYFNLQGINYFLNISLSLEKI